MARLPDGTVTFLFTDIEQSTAWLDQFPEVMPGATERHFDLITAEVARHGGWVFKRVGDECCAVFHSPAGAFAAALSAQAALSSEPWGDLAAGFGPLKVRMGLHTGAAKRLGEDYHGATLSVVARLLDLVSGGQVALTGDVAERVAAALPAGVSLVDLGLVPLRGLRRVVHLYGVVGLGLDPVTPPRHGAVVVLDESVDPVDTEMLEAAIVTAVRTGTPARMSAADLRQLLLRRPADLTAYRVGRVAEWTQGHHELDRRFVRLLLLIDRGDASQGLGADRWEATQRQYDDLGELLGEVPDPALVLLGPPGCGKTTLLRRLELDLARQGLLESEGPLTFLLPLNAYRGTEEPADWLAARWAARYPTLPPLAELQQAGRLVLLLDGLNEMPHRDDAEYRALIGRWRRYLAEVAADSPGSRVVFSCRTLDYSAPLSTGALRVPQVVVQPMGDEAVRGFLKAYCPVQAESVWSSMTEQGLGSVVRTPYLLGIIAQQAVLEGGVPEGAAGLFTGLVRSALQREVERGNPHFEPGGVLTLGEYRHLVQRAPWLSPYDLPDEGPLEPGLRRLAFEMQRNRPEQGGQGGEVRLPLSAAAALLNGAQAEDVIRAGQDLGVVVEDLATAELQFGHQLVQEYFAARELARHPRLELTRVEWRAAKLRPSLAETVAALAPPDPLPPAPGTGWEETMILAAAMAPAPVGLMRELMAENLVLAGRAAAVPELRRRLPAGLLDELRWALVERSRDPAADLRARIAAGLALGELGDPRFERHVGPYGDYLLPPFVEIPGGLYAIGSDDGIYPDEEAPVHQVQIAPFKLAVFPVTNAEWALFMKAGGYEQERWWPTEDARAWRRGEGTRLGSRTQVFGVYLGLRADPSRLDRLFASGGVPRDWYDIWKERLVMDPEAFEADLAARRPDVRISQPRYWGDQAFSAAAMPIVGISWYEALAYCTWLEEQSRLPFRLASETEWEAAARGGDARRYPFGDVLTPEHCNTIEAHVRGLTPVGVFPAGTTPSGLVDMAGNSSDWTLSPFHEDIDRRFDYVRSDQPLNLSAGPTTHRVSKGGAWGFDATYARAACRYYLLPSSQVDVVGLRLALGAGA